jgi:hypothetical protein
VERWWHGEFCAQSCRAGGALARLADVVSKLVAVVSRLDDETSDTAAAAFDSDVPRVAGHKATAQELKTLSNTLDSWLKEWHAQGDG